MTYIKRGNRISLLPVSQYCGLAAELSERHGAGRAAAMSSAFHARMANAPDANEKAARLTPAELQTISLWTKPSPVTVMGRELTYEAAEKEQPVGLTVTGEWADDGDVVTCGTLDFAWVHADVAYVGDMKKTIWASSGPDSLQLLAYGYAWAKKNHCRAFTVGLWIIEDAEWVWSDKVYSMDDFDTIDVWSRIAYAALNRTGEASFGDHCKDCYARLHCPEYTLPAQFAETSLACVAVDGPITDPAKLTELLLLCDRLGPLFDKVRDNVKEAVRRGVVLENGDKVFRAIPCKGRESLNQTKLFAELPEATRFVERGNGYEMFKWTKKAGKKK